MADRNENLIIEEVLGGDIDKFELLVERYQRGLCTYLANMLGDSMQAEDIAQDTFLNAYQKLNTYNPDYSFSTWLYRIGRNLALKQIGKKHVEPLDDTLPATDKSVAKEVEDKDESKAIRAAIRKLKPEYQEVINLFYWEDKAYEEMSLILDKPIGTVRTWLHRAKESLREELYGQIG